MTKPRFVGPLQPGNRPGCCVRKHGHASKYGATRTYRSWQSMRERCLKPTHVFYPHYGGRGIQISQAWSDFAVFLADMGERPAGCSLDRIDNSGNYEAGNCRWATRKEQNRNTRSNLLIEFSGTKRCVAEWSEITGLSKVCIRLRILAGWSAEKALSTPPRQRAT